MMKTRFCPSPTGYIHFGNARTALFAALLAQSQQGELLLRIEDTDQERSEDKYTQQLIADLHWLGIKWQEGPEVGGNAGPYWQSQRQSIYDNYYLRLEAQHLAYPCFCSPRELEISRKIQASQGRPPRYAGTCRSLTAEQIAEKRAKGLQATLRFRVPAQTMVCFEDFVKGEQRFNTDDIGDFIIRRTDGTAPFLFCNAVDDAMMGVTHVIRGEDHLTNTPRQILLLQALELPIPHYGHISLIVGSDGSPLSKRHGSRSIMTLREEGFLADGVNNYLARLGHYYADNQFMSLDKLAKQFHTDNLAKAPAHFDENHLLYWQREAVIHSNPEDFWHWLGADVQGMVPAKDRELFITTVKPNVTFPQDAMEWAKVIYNEQMLIDDDAKTVLQNTAEEFFTVAAAAIDNHDVDYEKLTAELKTKLNVNGKALFQPLRAALTGKLHGPELKGLLQLLGKDKLGKRLRQPRI